MNTDALSDVLRAVRLRGAVFFNISASDEWAAEAPPGQHLAPLIMRGVDHVIEYHVIAQGRCWVGIPGGPSVQASAGDVVLFPHGDAHVVSSAPGLRGVANFSWFAGPKAEPLPLQLSYRGTNVVHARALDGNAETIIVCGFLGCDLKPFNPLIDSLPRLLHLPAEEGNTWIASLTQQAVSESHAQRPGTQAMLARMSEMMFVDAVRRHADHLPMNATGWLSGLRDHFVGRVLALMHDRPAHDWTLDELGRDVGISRSALHERFVQLMGVPPMQYLTQWRMQSAARLLMETRSTVAAIALDVGYDSEAAFARAFKRAVGKPPATWRRERDELMVAEPAPRIDAAAESAAA